MMKEDLCIMHQLKYFQESLKSKSFQLGITFSDSEYGIGVLQYSLTLDFIQNICCPRASFFARRVETTLVNPIIIVVYRSAGPDKSADFVMNCY